MSFTRPNRSNEESQGGDKEFQTTPEGTWVCSLKLKDCEVAKWAKKSDGTRYKTDEKREGVRFVFKVEDKDYYIVKSLPKTEHRNGGLYKFMQELSNSLLKEVTFNEKNFAEDTTLFYDILEKLQEKKYNVEVIHATSGDRVFANVKSVSPIDPSKEDLLKDVSYDDDLIPF